MLLQVVSQTNTLLVRFLDHKSTDRPENFKKQMKSQWEALYVGAMYESSPPIAWETKLTIGGK